MQTCLVVKVELTDLVQVGDRIFTPKIGGARYDFSPVVDDSERPRLVACIDLLYATARKVGGPTQEILQGVSARNGRTIVFYSSQDAFVRGTPLQPVTYIDPGGTACWKWIKTSGVRALYCRPETPVAERDDERIYCKSDNPVLNFGPYVNTVWHEMTHIFTLLYHGKWNPKGGFENPSSPENIAWHAFMQRLKASAPPFAKDPITGEPDYIGATSTEWSCACGATHTA